MFNNLKIDTEYYFYFNNYICSGFVSSIDKDVLYLYNGNFYYQNSEIFPYDFAYFFFKDIIGFSTT